MKAGYAFQQEKENIAKASGRNLNISPKQSIEICNYLRGRSLAQAKNLLQMSIDMIKPIPFKIFTNGLGHKSGMGPGRFNPKACSEILKIIKSAEANAKNNGMNVASLKVLHITSQRANKSWHYGRKKRSIFKNTHIEVVLEESKDVKVDKKKSTDVKTPKTTKPKTEKIAKKTETHTHKETKDTEDKNN